MEIPRNCESYDCDTWAVVVDEDFLAALDNETAHNSPQAVRVHQQVIHCGKGSPNSLQSQMNTVNQLTHTASKSKGFGMAAAPNQLYIRHRLKNTCLWIFHMIWPPSPIFKRQLNSMNSRRKTLLYYKLRVPIVKSNAMNKKSVLRTLF